MLEKINKNIINIAKTIAPVVSSKDLILNLKKKYLLSMPMKKLVKCCE